MRSAPTIAFDWQPSRAWRALRWTAIAVGGGCLVWSGLDVLAKVALALLTAWMEGRARRVEQTWRGSRWMLDAAGQWTWRRRDGSEGHGVLSQSTVLGPLLLLNLEVSPSRVDLAIWPDCLDAITRRRLRVRLSTLVDADAAANAGSGRDPVTP